MTGRDRRRPVISIATRTNRARNGPLSAHHTPPETFPDLNVDFTPRRRTAVFPRGHFDEGL
jgi:hypothetical protein